MYSSMTRKLTVFFLLAGMGFTASLAFAGTTELVSVSGSGVQGNNYSGPSGINADGRYVAFLSAADNLVDGDTNGTADIFVRDRQTGTTERVNISSTGAQANAGAYGAVLSGDGRFVAFESMSDNLVAGDTNATLDVFVHDRLTGVTERVSVGPGGAEANSWSDECAISADGRFVAFVSTATNLTPGVPYGHWQVYVYDRVNRTTELVSKSSDGTAGNDLSSAPVISADGRYIAYSSRADNIVANDTNGNYDVFVYDRVAKFSENANVSAAGVQGGTVSYPSLSADGRYVAFVSSGLVPGFDGLYIRDRWNNTVKAVAGATDYPSMSGDGRFVAYRSQIQGGYSQVNLFDQISNSYEAISVDNSGNYGNDQSGPPLISADGSMVAFTSWSTNLVPGDTNGTLDVFVRDRSTIQIIVALFNYRSHVLTLEVTSNAGATDNLAVSGFGPMNWNAGTGSWQLTATNVTTAPSSINVTGNSGSKIIQ